MSEIFSFRGQISDVVSRLFYYTDNLEWEKLKKEVFATKVKFDATSLGAHKAETLSAQAICHMWDNNLRHLDAVHHQAGNYIIDLKDNTADVIAYARVTHFTKGEAIKEFVGSYNLHLTKFDEGWRIDSFCFNLKYMN